MPPPPDARRLPVATGVSLHALVWPHGRARPFLLVHGLSSNCLTWEAVAAHLQDQRHPVAAVDLRGHGLSDKPDEGYDFATLTADLAKALDALGFEDPVVAGQSTGGNLALELAHRAPERVTAAVGVDGALELSRRWPRWEDCEAALAPPRLDGMSVEEFEAMLRRRHPTWSDAGVAATLANLEVLGDGTIRPRLTRERHLRMLHALWEHRPSTLFGALKVPFLLVVAEPDGEPAATGNDEVAMAQSAGPHIRVERLAGDHDLHVERPQEVAALLMGAAGYGVSAS